MDFFSAVLTIVAVPFIFLSLVLSVVLIAVMFDIVGRWF